MKKMLVILSTILWLSGNCPTLAVAKVRLPHFISHGMVLQQGRPLPLWGWADAYQTVTVTLNNHRYITQANKQGAWRITLPPQQAGGPYTLQVNDMMVSDVLVGEVWLCSGQSNMELPIRRVLDLYRAQIDTTNNPHIRHLKVPLAYSFEKPTADITGGKWTSATPGEIMDIAATAYFFAQELYRVYGVPIGIINSSVGGSPAEAWISAGGLAPFPHYLAQARQCAQAGYVDSVQQADARMQAQWYSTLNAHDKGLAQHWQHYTPAMEQWETMSLPGYWANSTWGQVNGVAWFARKVVLPDSLAGREAILRLGCIVDSDSAFVNGIFVGTTGYQYPPRIYRIPWGVLRSGTNTITLRVVNTGGRGGFVPDKPYQLEIGHTTIGLQGAWHAQWGATMPPIGSTTAFQYKPTGLYNAMIAPLVPYAIRGVAWYQGESNAGRYADYGALLSALISNWRADWAQPTLPFVYVQLPNFGQPSAQPTDSDWARLREQQLHTLQLAHTGMAVAIDIGEWNDIHPLNKKDVGYRLALAARKVAYGEDVVAWGPLYKAMRTEGNKIILSFDGVGKGLEAELTLQGFAIADSSRRFVWAQAQVVGTEVEVWSPQVLHPVAVRYAWGMNPAGANLRNQEGLPASPFRTDKWE